MWWIVSGPSSVGKSTFIGSPRFAELTGLPTGAPVVWPNDADGGADPATEDGVFHYNILRPFSKPRGGEPTPERFDDDEAWATMAGLPEPKRAIVLVASRRAIERRTMERSVKEQPAIRGTDAAPYASHKYLRRLERVDLAAAYRAWCGRLRQQGIPYLLVSSEDPSYPVIESEADVQQIVDGERRPEPSSGPYTRETILGILADNDFGYHRIELPFGLSTGGDDRSATRDLVLPASLVGESVLDVGCAFGYFSFEAEARGAGRVVGVDVSEERLRGARLLNDIKGASVAFELRDVVLNPPQESFDHVLFLNVIHHLTEPFRALRQLAAVARKRLVVEFPTLDDRRFRASLAADLPPGISDFPLVGVSSMGPRVRQTFVFAPSAIERALLDHERLVDRVEVVPSPLPGRAIAICHKDPGGRRSPRRRRTRGAGG